MPATPVFKGSFASSHNCRPATDVGDVIGTLEELDPMLFIAVTNTLYDVFTVSPENTAYLLARPWSSDGVVREPFKL